MRHIAQSKAAIESTSVVVGLVCRFNPVDELADHSRSRSHIHRKNHPMPLALREIARVTAADANAANTRGFFVDRQVCIRVGAVLNLDKRAVLIALMQVRVENVGDQSPLVDQGATAVGRNSMVHGVALDIVIRGRFAAGVLHDLGCLAADVGDSECRGRAETGLCGHETAQTIPIPQILTNRRSQIAIVKIPLPRDSSSLPSAEVENVLFDVGAACAFGENPIHFVGRECTAPDSKIIESGINSSGSATRVYAGAVLADIESKAARWGHVVAGGSQRLDIDNYSVKIGCRTPVALECNGNVMPDSVGKGTRSPVIAFRGSRRPCKIPAQAAIGSAGDTPTLGALARPVFVGDERKLARLVGIAHPKADRKICDGAEVEIGWSAQSDEIEFTAILFGGKMKSAATAFSGFSVTRRTDCSSVIVSGAVIVSAFECQMCDQLI